MSSTTRLVLALILAGCTPTATINLGGGFSDVPPATSDAASSDAVMLTDVTPLPDGAVHEDAAVTDATGPLIAWGAGCARRSDNCAAPAGERGVCSIVRGTPVCMHTCNGQPAYSLCEGDRGVCVDGGDGQRYCLPKCGDGATCAPGAACAWLGYRTVGDGGITGVGVCLGSCTASGPDACMSPGTACNPTTLNCVPNDCESLCPAGTTCQNGLCNPPTPAALYSPCNPAMGAAVVCSQDYCLGDRTSGSGFCTQACDSNTSSLTCGTGVCFFGLNVASSVSGSMGATITGYWESSFNTLGGRLSGACMKACVTSADCPTRFSCQTYNGVRACIPYSIPEGTVTPGAGLPGSLCRSNTDCATNNCLLVPGYRDGVCRRVSLATPCPMGTAPLRLSTGEDLACVRSCDRQRDNECPGSWRCNGDSLCANVACRTNNDCAAGTTCDLVSNLCVAAPPSGTGGVGAPCTADAMCRGGTCLMPSTNNGVTTWNGGYCTLGCTGLAGGGDTCPAGSYCSTHFVGAQGVCLKLCDVSGAARFGGCRAGYNCSPFQGDGRHGLCLD